MKTKKYHILAKLFLCIFLTHCGNSGTASEQELATISPSKPSLSTWMTDHQTELAKKALNAIVIPGSHDAATFGVTDRSETCPAFNDDATKFIATERSILGNNRFSALWAVTQPEDLITQLAAGIRYFDFRMCKSSGGSLRIEHTLLGSLAIPSLRALAAFATSHPKEIIIISLTLAGAETAQEKLELYHSQIQPIFQNRIASKDLRPTSLVEEFWNQNKNVVIILGLDSNVVQSKAQTGWSSNLLDSRWAGLTGSGPERVSTQRAYEILNYIAREAENPSRHAKLHSSGATLSFDLRDGVAFLQDVLSGKLNITSDVLELSDQINTPLIQNLKGFWLSGKLNIVSYDNATHPGVSEAIIQRNFR